MGGTGSHLGRPPGLAVCIQSCHALIVRRLRLWRRGSGFVGGRSDQWPRSRLSLAFECERTLSIVQEDLEYEEILPV